MEYTTSKYVGRHMRYVRWRRSRTYDERRRGAAARLVFNAISTGARAAGTKMSTRPGIRYAEIDPAVPARSHHRASTPTAGDPAFGGRSGRVRSRRWIRR